MLDLQKMNEAAGVGEAVGLTAVTTSCEPGRCNTQLGGGLVTAGQAVSVLFGTLYSHIPVSEL